ncbi:DUF3592 domain-containing protein [Acetobacterium wieringae]|uniref:DUF3592 domain-containing protein n=2 Tax=Acetobacterium TaxID=33951 RepID=A0A1F2PFS2_9FIRM|nr:DUF3592 domain-containing protein [Acetobacterium wieringae]OFV69712.1 hypothetical protein ACWI_28500 [Acetobacterium wieringae]URN85729.1 DUF3592 domain-containing protein [Acetobacterium wieringae]
MISLILVIIRIVGIVLIIFSILKLMKLKIIEKSGIQVEAVVVGMRENKVRTGRQVYDEYTPILEYMIAEKVYRTAALASQGDKRYDLGDIVKIRYKSDRPEEIMIPGDHRYYFNPALFGIAGIMIEILVLLTQRFL